jgi:hypothetical protein
MMVLRIKVIFEQEIELSQGKIKVTWHDPLLHGHVNLFLVNSIPPAPITPISV